ncbi:Putative serine/threonine-protein kinase, active [Septoria linicola]|uniref:non-specific serine/threonine protein kinase n=1 Tax=Septoria linicola TaxID=215465 RepID=A0A9Q9EQ76_9PEZI|nr:putative serine/threonine-protein kinase, active [Septoria linicola]USW58502.1 Putative serine/threonine-protein kinase, active [Septoria linicola]
MEVDAAWPQAFVQAWRDDKNTRGQRMTNRGEAMIEGAARTAWETLDLTVQEDFIRAVGQRDDALGAITPLTGIGPTPDTEDRSILRPYYRRAWDLLVARRKLSLAYTDIIAVLGATSAATVRTRRYLETVADNNVCLAREGLDALEATLGRLGDWRPSRFNEIVNEGDPVPADDSDTLTAYLLSRFRALEAQYEIRGRSRKRLRRAIRAKRDLPDNASRRLVAFLRREYRSYDAVDSSFTELLEGLQTYHEFRKGLEGLEATITTLGERDVENRVQFQYHIALHERLAAMLGLANTALNDLLTLRLARSDAMTAKLETHLRTKQQQLQIVFQQLTNVDLPDWRKQYQDRHGEQEKQSLWLGNAVSPWESRRQIGNGAHGRVAAWVKVDHEGTIIDRLARKDAANENPNDSAGWSNVWRWPTDETMPSEVAAMYKLRPLKGSSDCIVQIRNWRKVSKEDGASRQRFILYMELCQRGDLWRVRNLHQGDPNPSLPPEPFLWSVLESLCDAGLLMQYGEIAPHGDLADVWPSIIHGDMKADNMVLDHNSSGKFSGYPRAKLADFGIAFLHPAEPSSRWRSFGGQTYSSPESRNDAGRNQPPDAKANVFGMGLICRALMNTTYQNPQSAITWMPLAQASYSKQLLDLVQSCLNDDPTQRPSFAQIKTTVCKKSGSPRHDIAVDMRTAPVDDPRFANAPVRTIDLDIPMAMAIDEQWELDDKTLPGGPTGQQIGPPPAEEESTEEGTPIVPTPGGCNPA